MYKTVYNENLFKNLFAMVEEGHCTREVVLNAENMSFYKYRRRDFSTKLSYCNALADMDQAYLKMNDVEEVLLGGDRN